MVYIHAVVEVVQSATFAKWLSKLADRRSRARVQVRIDRLALSNPGDVKAVGKGISEMRIDHGPGYRIYFCSAVRPSSSCSAVEPNATSRPIFGEQSRSPASGETEKDGTQDESSRDVLSLRHRRLPQDRG